MKKTPTIRFCKGCNKRFESFKWKKYCCESCRTAYLNMKWNGNAKILREEGLNL